MSTENTFKSSLKSFQLSRGNNAGISLPTNTGASSTSGSAFQSFRDSATNAFSSVSSTIQGYNPLGSGDIEEEEDPWYQLSRVERVMAFALCLVLGVGCFALSFFFLPLFPGKFAATFTLGSILILVSVALLRGPLSHIKHMISMERLPFTVSYVGSMILTLYAALGLRAMILTIIFAIIQIVALIWYVGSYIPGGVSTLRYGTAYIGRRAVSILPI
ncbi:Protein transport protein sft2 [Mucor circinelloides]